MDFHWNHKRVYRVYTAMNLNIRRRAKKRGYLQEQNSSYFSRLGLIMFGSDSLWNAKRYRLLNVIDDYNRQALAIEADTSLPALRVIRTLERLKDNRGLPKMIRVDSGPEFISNKLDAWCKDNKVELAFIQPGKPTQNAFIERLNGSLRRELLNAYIFRTLSKVRDKAYDWMEDYNPNRPHKALNYKTPMELM